MAAQGNDQEPVVQIEEVTKAFGDLEVLRGVNLIVNRGMNMVLLGGSGSGKSVLLSILIGLLKADNGRVMIGEKEITSFQSEADWKEIWKKMGFLFQGAALFDSMNVRDNIAFPLEMHTKLKRTEIDEKVKRLLKLVELGNIQEKLPSELSGGMQKRVSLARTIALEPEMILYDEPTTGLDPVTSDTIAVLIRQLQEKLGITSLIVTHDIRLAFQVADSVSMLHEGKILMTSSLEEIKNNPDPRVREFLYG